MKAEIRVELRDLPAVKLLLWELRKLADEMRVSADPYAERLERTLDRMLAYGDDDARRP